LVLVPKFNADLVMKLITKYKVTMFPGVPAMYSAVCNCKRDRNCDLSSLRICISGAAPLPMDLQERFEQLTGARLVEGYGLTECSPVTHVNPIDGVRKSSSIGLPLPNTEAAILDQHTQKPLSVGEVGELAIKGPQVMRGYWRDTEETNQHFTSNGWLLTGDLARMDEDGFFYILDRKKDLIISGGFNIFPHEVENVLLEHPNVKEAAAVGMPDDILGEKVMAFLVQKDRTVQTKEDYLAFCEGKLAKYKIPKEIEFLDDLPKNLLGKTLKRVLINDFSA